MAKEKDFFENVKKYDDCVIKALQNDEYLKNNFEKIYSNNSFLDASLDKYGEILERAHQEKNILKRWMFKESIMALNNIKKYKKILNNPLIKNAIRANNSFKEKIPELLNLNNEKLKEKVGQMFGTNIMSNNITIILNNSKRFLNSKVFEKKEDLIENTKNENGESKYPKVLQRIKKRIGM